MVLLRYLDVGVVDNESALSYKWLLSTFLSAIYQNKPSSIITDGCPSMAKAIRTVLPEMTHTLCSWHIEQNMMCYLHNSNIKGFRALMYNTHDPNDFEKKWGDYIKQSEKLKANKWLKLMYKSKEQWATAYLKKKVLLGMKSNQRSESLNSRLHKHLDRNMCLLDLVEHYEHCLSRIRRNEIELDCKASQSIPVLKTVYRELENEVAQINTPKIFYRIREEINLVKEYQVVEVQDIDDSKWYVLEEVNNPQEVIYVECYGGERFENVKRSCEKLACEKIPCSHILKVLIEVKKNVILECCIWDRWTKCPKTNSPSLKRGLSFNWSEQYKRNREMTKLGSKIFHEASKSEIEYFEVMQLLSHLELKQKKKRNINQKMYWIRNLNQNRGSMSLIPKLWSVEEHQRIGSSLFVRGKKEDVEIVGYLDIIEQHVQISDSWFSF